MRSMQPLWLRSVSEAPERKEHTLIINGKSLLEAAPIINMEPYKMVSPSGITSYGLTECGYDIRIKQDIRFVPQKDGSCLTSVLEPSKSRLEFINGRFVLASSMEEFQMPQHLMGQVLNKSTWARLGLDASMTTNIEPGWNGFLTLELTYHGYTDIHIPAGTGIAQVMFHEVLEHVSYKGKYQDQANKPEPARFANPTSVAGELAKEDSVKIWDAKGVHPENLDRAVRDQAGYFKRGFTPK